MTGPEMGGVAHAMYVLYQVHKVTDKRHLVRARAVEPHRAFPFFGPDDPRLPSNRRTQVEQGSPGRAESRIGLGKALVGGVFQVLELGPDVLVRLGLEFFERHAGAS